MKIRAGLLTPFLALHACWAGSSEFHLTINRQVSNESSLYPARDYQVQSLVYVFEPHQKFEGPIFQWCFSIAKGASNRSSSVSPAGSSYYKPGGYGSIGLRMLSKGTFRFGAGLEMRAGADNKGGVSGDTGNSGLYLYTRPWISVIMQYHYLNTQPAPVFSISVGTTNSEIPGSPRRELGVSAGIRF